MLGMKSSKINNDIVNEIQDGGGREKRTKTTKMNDNDLLIVAPEEELLEMIACCITVTNALSCTTISTTEP